MLLLHPTFLLLHLQHLCPLSFFFSFRRAFSHHSIDSMQSYASYNHISGGQPRGSNTVGYDCRDPVDYASRPPTSRSSSRLNHARAYNTANQNFVNAWNVGPQSASYNYTSNVSGAFPVSGLVPFSLSPSPSSIKSQRLTGSTVSYNLDVAQGAYATTTKYARKPQRQFHILDPNTGAVIGNYQAGTHAQAAKHAYAKGRDFIHVMDPETRNVYTYQGVREPPSSEWAAKRGFNHIRVYSTGHYKMP